MEGSSIPSTSDSVVGATAPRIGMSISPPEVSSIPRVSGTDSSTPVMIDSPVFVSRDTCDPTQEDGETQQGGTEDTNRQQGDIAEDDDKFRVPKRNKTSEAWEDFDDLEENGIYYAICKHCSKKLNRGKTKQTSSMWRHRENCSVRKAKLRRAEQQTKINFQQADERFPTIPCFTCSGDSPDVNVCRRLV